MQISTNDYEIKFHADSLHDILVIGRLAGALPEFGYYLSSPGSIDEMETKSDFRSLKENIKNCEGSVRIEEGFFVTMSSDGDTINIQFLDDLITILTRIA